MISGLLSLGLFSIVLEAAVRALLAALVVWGVLRFLRVTHVPALKAAWTLVLLTAIAMPLLMREHWLPAAATVKLPALPWVPAAQIQPGKATASPTALTTPVEPLFAASVEEEAAPAATDRFSAPDVYAPDTVPAAQPLDATTFSPRPAAHASTTNWPRLSTLCGAAYLLVCAALLLRLLVGLAAALRVWWTAQPVHPALESGLAAGADVRSSLRVASPVNVGSGVVLPTDFSTWPPEKLRIVLAHERAHIRQGDFYLQLLAGLYAAVFWFSPLGWWLKHKLSELGEAISDRAGLEEAASRTGYAQLLLEFAAQPRPTLIGVAMARTTNLSSRIERLLNENHFRRAFTGIRRHVLAAVLVIPAVVLATAALVRVQAAAAGQQTGQLQTTAQSPYTGTATPDQTPPTVTEPAQPPTPAPAPNPAVAPPPAQPMPQAAPAPPPAPGAQPAPAAAPAPPMPGIAVQPPMPPMPAAPDDINIKPLHLDLHLDHFYIHNGDPYAIVGDPDSRLGMMSGWNQTSEADIAKARKMAHGHFLWFRHDGKSYIVDDPTVMAQIEAMNKPMQDLGKQMRALREQQRQIGRQEREKMRRQLNRQIPAPDLSKQMADLNAAMAKLDTLKGSTISEEQLAELQRKLGEMQAKLGSLRVKLYVPDTQFAQEMGKFGEQQGKLGAQMGLLARENQNKIGSIIQQSLQNGKARPVQ